MFHDNKVVLKHVFGSRNVLRNMFQLRKTCSGTSSMSKNLFWNMFSKFGNMFQLVKTCFGTCFMSINLFWNIFPSTKTCFGVRNLFWNMFEAHPEKNMFWTSLTTKNSHWQRIGHMKHHISSEQLNRIRREFAVCQSQENEEWWKKELISNRLVLLELSSIGRRNKTREKSSQERAPWGLIMKFDPSSLGGLERDRCSEKECKSAYSMFWGSLISYQW